ncbi:MAG: tetratricopeptide repeat protein, partial [Acidimicrobiia bacterium]
VAAVRSCTDVLVVTGDAGSRALAAGQVRHRGEVVEVRPAAPLGPWAGLSLIVDAVVGHVPAAVPPALEAARSGHPVGDHRGLGADLRALLLAAADEAPISLVVHDAHLLDLSSAGALSHALLVPPAGSHVLITQDRSDRGVRGLPVHHAGGTAEPVEPPADAHAAAAAGAVLDAAWAAEAAGDVASAARWWLEGGRPGRCRRALEHLGAAAQGSEVAARLAHLTASARRWHAAIDEAVTTIAPDDPLAATRLLLLDAAARVLHGDAVGARTVLDTADGLLRLVPDDRQRRPVADLHDLVAATADVSRGGAPTLLLEHLERPLARLGTGLDPDAVRLLASAAMPLGWAGHLVEARALLDRLVGVLHGRRRFLPLPQPLATSAWLARRRSRVEVALTDGARAIELGRAAGAANDVRFATGEVAHVEALQGRLDDCRAHVAQLVPDGVPRGAAQIGAVSALAVGELLADRPEQAVELLERVQRIAGDSVSPAHTAWRHNLAEAYVRTGRTRDAAAVLRELEAWAARSGSPREHGQVAWCRGMLAGVGQHDEHFRRARTLLDPYPALRWRCELFHLRRLLDEARLGEAAPLAERLAAEAGPAGVAGGLVQVQRLQAAHGLARTSVVAGSPALSVDDLRVALALVEGADDDEIAGRLQVTARGVDDSRARVLAALGVDGVAELGAVLPIERSEPRAAAAEIRVLGPTAVVSGDHHAVPPPGRPATVLALVAAEGSVPVDRIVDVLWPDDDPVRSRARLRNVLARLRASVGPVVVRDGERLALGAGVSVDAHRFEALAERALGARPDDVERCSDAALAAWTGLPLPAWPYEDWAGEQRRRLVDRCVAVLVARARSRVERGAADAALDDLELALGLQPDAVELWEQAIALAIADRRTGRERALRRRAAEREVELVTGGVPADRQRPS